MDRLRQIRLPGREKEKIGLQDIFLCVVDTLDYENFEGETLLGGA